MFAEHSESLKAVPEDVDGLEVFASYLQGNVAGPVYVSKSGYGTEVIYGDAGIAIVPGEGVRGSESTPTVESLTPRLR